MTNKYTMQILNKKNNFFDINIYNEEKARGMLEEYLKCENPAEKSFKTKVIFDEIKKGNLFTIAESDGTRITFRIATENDIKTESLYRQEEENVINSFLSPEQKAHIEAMKEYFTNNELDSMD